MGGPGSGERTGIEKRHLENNIRLSSEIVQRELRKRPTDKEGIRRQVDIAVQIFLRGMPSKVINSGEMEKILVNIIQADKQPIENKDGNTNRLQANSEANGSVQPLNK